MLCVVAIAAANSQFSVRSYASLFKIDFGQLENEREIVDVDGNPTGTFPEPLKDWDIIGTWTFEDPTSNGGKGVANADHTAVTWNLTDWSQDLPKEADVTLTIIDNKALAEQLNPEAPPYMLGQTANNPTKEGLQAVYDGVVVPAVVKDDYLYRAPDTAGTEVLMRFANLNPGIYNVTVFEGRTSDGNGRYGKVWVDDIDGKKEPAEQNTGNYSGVNASGVAVPLGQPRTLTVTLKAGEFLWFAEMEDNSGGISGVIIRSVAAAPPPVDISTSKGLFKLDFGHLENERIPLDADGNPTGDAPAPLKDWNVIPTWTFSDPNVNVVAGGASIEGTANADGTEVTWKLTDYSKDANKNVTMTIMDNVALSTSLGLDAPAGQTANNPTKDAYEALYDGVVVPAIVKDDYNYRTPDTAGTELLMRFAGLNPGKYNVTVFEGRTSDGNGRFGKIWVDDIKGAKEPAEQNTGNYSGVNLDVGGVPTPTGQPRTLVVDIKAGEYLWFAEMEDNSGGISGVIIRGVGDGTTPPTPGPITDGLKAYWTFDGNLNDSINNFHGTARGTTPIAFADGKAGFGKSIKLDGGNQFVEITGGSEDDLEFPGRSMSIAGWFKVDAFDTEWQALIAKGEGSNYRVARRASTGTIAYAGGVGEGADDVPVVNNGQWHHFVAISDATGAQFGTALYVDGVIHGINTTKPALAANNARLMIGENPEARGREWEGEIDDIAIWNRVLTPAEITSLYNGGAGTPLGKLAGIAPPLTLTVSRTAGGIAITYTGTLQAASTVTGPYADVTGATSPYSANTTGAAQFFRAKQ